VRSGAYCSYRGAIALSRREVGGQRVGSFEDEGDVEELVNADRVKVRLFFQSLAFFFRRIDS